MLYLLDANVLITAHTLYYPVDAVPEFWSWLAHHASLGSLKIPIENFEEVKDGGTDEEKDLLFGWVSEANVRDHLVFNAQSDPKVVADVINRGYAADLTEEEILVVGRDPFLIAHALASPKDRCVVTTEVSKPTRRRHNRHIPDVCNALGVQCCDTFKMMKALGFKTGWKP
jgi:hypothetical protein